MPYIYTEADKLGNSKKVGTGDCVALVPTYANVPSHVEWREGEKVLDNPHIRKGTAIATFVKKRYPNKAHGNHAAFFLRHGPKGNGFWVMDQWKNDKDKPVVQSRYITVKPGPRGADGSYYRASDNAEAFSIIEYEYANSSTASIACHGAGDTRTPVSKCRQRKRPSPVMSSRIANGQRHNFSAAWISGAPDKPTTTEKRRTHVRPSFEHDDFGTVLGAGSSQFHHPDLGRPRIRQREMDGVFLWDGP